MQYEPQAASRNVVVFGKARFTFLTPRMVRLEYDSGATFEDRATLAVVNRKMPAVKFTRKESGRRLTLKTAGLELSYLDDGRKFSAANLQIRVTTPTGRRTWKPGMKDPNALPGTGRTLDGVDGDKHTWGSWKGKPIQRPDALISRSGWAVYDDSRNVVRTEDGWVGPRSDRHRQDLYFLGYGQDYKTALADASKVFGRQPLPPRYTLGLWWSRYWSYTDEELRGIVEEFEAMNVPLDVLVIDMDWHLEGWGGYTWDRRYFPDPKRLLKWLKQRGLRITLNLHPADGVGSHEEAYPQMAKALGKDPARKKKIPFDCADRRYMDAYFKYLHHPQEKAGVDFWWMDWQQGHTSKMPGLDPLPWLNVTHWEDQERRGLRPLNFSRYGGLGSGRYPIGFSGDTHTTWESLAFQPQFTADAANVLYGYWSHDIGGHMGPGFTPELYLRWIQFGVFSPILRIHTTKYHGNERRFWEMPSDYSRHMIHAVQQRYELAPYIYSENARNVETGSSLCRPLYHDWPKEKKAYDCPHEYLFGSQMLVAPITAPADENTKLAQTDIYLPPGEWFDVSLGRTERGGQTIKRNYMFGETPVFVRGGAVIPGLGGNAKRLAEGSYPTLLATVYPGKAGQYELFEDDGISADSGSAIIKFSQRTTGGKTVVTVAKAAGTYKGFRPRRELEVRLPATVPPKKVTVGGKAVPQASEQSGLGWSYDGATATTFIRVKAIDLGKSTRVEVTHGAKPKAGQGWAGIMHRLKWICVMTQRGPNPVKHPYSDFDRLSAHLAQAGLRATYDPNCFQAEVAEVRKELPTLAGKLSRLARHVSNHKVWSWNKSGVEKAQGVGHCITMLKLMKREKQF